MLLDLIDLSKLRRTIVYGLVLAALFTVQDLIVAEITLKGVRGMMVPAFVIGVGLFEGGVWGGLLGLAAGYFTDMGLTNHVALFTILLPVAGFFAGALGKYMLHKGFLSYMALVLITVCVIAFCQMFRFLFLLDIDTQQFHALMYGTGATALVWRTGLLQIVWSLVWSIPIYFPCKYISARPLGR